MVLSRVLGGSLALGRKLFVVPNRINYVAYWVINTKRVAGTVLRVGLCVFILLIHS